MVPGHGAARWRALRLQAMGDGILDASVPRRGEMMKPQDEGRAAWIARQKAAVDRALDALEADPPHHAIDIGSITIGCALGYLDFRFAAQPWRPGHPRLAAWYEAFARNPGIANTVPKDPG
jgi:glutathione S-transferase